MCSAHFWMYLKIKPMEAAYLGTGSLVSQTPWKTENKNRYLSTLFTKTTLSRVTRTSILGTQWLDKKNVPKYLIR